MSVTAYAKQSLMTDLDFLGWCRSTFGDEHTAQLIGVNCQGDLVNLMNRVSILSDKQTWRLEVLHALYGRALNATNGDEKAVHAWMIKTDSLDEGISPICAIGDDRDDIVGTGIEELEMDHAIQG